MHIPRRLVCLALLWLFAAGAAAAQQAPWQLPRDAASFDRADITRPALIEKIKSANNLAGAVGWFEYDFEVPAAGWYELILAGHGLELEYLVDSQDGNPTTAKYYVAGSLGFNGKDDKVANFWLERGRHKLRLKRHYWTGFPAITGFTLRESDGRLATSLRVTGTGSHGIFRKGECGVLTIEYGPRAKPAVLAVTWVNAVTFAGLGSFQVPLPATGVRATREWLIPCDREGQFVLYFQSTGSEPVANRDVHQRFYQVIDTSPGPYLGSPPGRTLLFSIDCASTPPDYQSDETRVVSRPFGAYRESGNRGWTETQHNRIGSRDSSWFAYVLRNLEKQRAYQVEIEYPDDAERTFAIALRESEPLSYPVAGGVDSGGEFTLSHRMQTHTLTFWPRATDPRIVFLPARSGQRAAAARVRVYRIDGALAPLVPRGAGGRSYANWYEEGSNFLSMYGAPGESPHGLGTALERWARSLAYMGGDTLWPTVAVYSFALYPSRFHQHFSRPWHHDILRQILLVAEKHGLKVVPELHPRADAVAWPFRDAPEPKPNLLVSGEGKTWQDLPPFYNPLHPENEKWYLGMIEELVERYRDAPSLTGVSLRFMQWKNPALHNFHSLDWGYDDLTIAFFEKDTGIRVGVPGFEPGRFDARRRWLLSNAREQWIAWRCRKIAELVTRIRDQVRALRSDLTIYIPVHPMTERGSTYNAGTAWLREAGIDPALLARIDGVVLVNALHGYGRRFDTATNQLLRNNLTSPALRRALAAPGTAATFLPYSVYFEAIEAVAPPEKLGFPASTPRTWMSAVVNPAGRNYLERFALLLADTDATLLGDGGNAYTLGQPELREFLSEYRRLPAVPFQPRPDARDPVAVWELAGPGEFLFYAVNRTGAPAEVRLTLSSPGPLTRLSSGEAVHLGSNELRLRLEPYQLAAYRGPATLRIISARRP